MSSPRRTVGGSRPKRRSASGQCRLRALESLEKRWVLTEPAVLEISPGINALSVPLETDVAIVFDQAVAALSVSPDAIVAHAEYSGRLPIAAQDISVAEATATIRLPRALLPGEHVTVTVTAGVTNSAGQSAQLFVWEFEASAIGGTGEFDDVPVIVGPLPHIAAIGDYDSDGDLDAFTGYYDQLYLNQGDGVFQKMGAGFEESHSRQVIAVDIDSDRDLDIVSVGANAISFWINDGRAHFTRQTGSATFGANLHFADLDGDGDQDAVFTTNEGTNVALNDGAGAFTTVLQRSATTSNLEQSAIGDLDSDGDLDVAINYAGGLGGELWINRGDATFSYQSIGLAGTPKIADINGDGNADLLLSSQLLLNWGGLRFTYAGVLGDSNAPGSPIHAIADFDGDGDLDALLDQSHNQQLFLNDGAGVFIATGVILPESHQDATAADFDLDGDIDLFQGQGSLGNVIWLNRGSAAQISVTASDGKHEVAANSPASYQIVVTNESDLAMPGAKVSAPIPRGLTSVSWTSTTSDGSSAPSSGSGAMNHLVDLAPRGSVTYTYRGTVDAIAGDTIALKVSAKPPAGILPGIDSAKLGGEGGDLSTVIIAPTAGSGFFRDSGVRLHDGVTDIATRDAQFGDLDGDGDQDAVLSLDHAAGEIWFNDGLGNFTRGTQAIGANTNGILFLRDANGDGDLDIYMGQYAGLSQITRLWVNDGHGVFTRADRSIPFYPYAFADVNGDGVTDALSLNTDGPERFEWMIGVSQTQFVNSGQFVPAFAEVAGDLDQDGDVDMIYSRYQGSPESDATTVWFNNGHGNFGPGAQRLPARSLENSVFGDVDGDGDLDWLIAGGYCQNCSPEERDRNELWLNLGHGEFTLDERELPRFAAGPSTLADFDGDGDLDAFLRYRTALGRSGVWRNDGSGGFVDVGQDWPDDEGRLYDEPRFADVDNDGDIDALLMGASSSVEGYLANRLWLNETEYAHLSTAISNDASSVRAGELLTYSVTVSNDGTIAAANLAVEQSLPDYFADVTWTSVVAGGAAATPSGVGAIADSIELPAGGSVTYTVLARVTLPSTSPMPQQARASIRVIPDASEFHPDRRRLAAADYDALTIPTFGGGYLANASADNLFDNFERGAFGDVDGDGDLDLVLGNRGLYVYRNDGRGQYTENRGPYFADSDISSISLIDIDGDGDLDVMPAKRNSHDTALSALENDGDGNFTPRFGGIGGAVFDSAVGDIDGDGDVDALFASTNGGVEILLQVEPWEWRPSTRTLLRDYIGGIALGDWDADGDLDVAVSESGAPVILLNDGKGEFPQIVRMTARVFVYDVVAGDLNADGHLDLYYASAGADKVWLNDGSGNFTDTGQSLGTADNLSAALGDLDGDGDLDAFALSEVWINDGTGQFLAADFPPPPAGAHYAAIGDMDGDGDADVMSGNRLWRNYEDLNNLAVTVTNGEDQLVYGAEVTYTFTVTNQGNHAIADASVAAAPAARLAGATWVSVGTVGTVSSPSGTGAIVDSITLPAGGSVTYTLIGVVNGAIGLPALAGLRITFPDGVNLFDPIDDNHALDSDLVVSSPMFGGTGRLVDSTQRLGGDTSSIQAADLDGDGDIDLWEGNRTGPSRVWLNDGAGNFSDSGQTLGDGGVRDVVLADFDGDVDLDAFVVLAGSADRIWLNSGNGVFALSAELVGDETSEGVAAAVADFDGDGFADIAIAESGDRQSQYWIGNGRGAFTLGGEIRGSQGSSDIAAADMDNDGDVDLVSSIAQHGRLNINDNQGGGQFGWPTGVRLAPTPLTSLAVGDFNADGNMEVVVGGIGGVDVFRNLGHGRLSYQQWIENPNVASVALGDLNGDGYLELLIGHGAPGAAMANEIWFERSSGIFTDGGQRLGRSYTNSFALGDFDGDGDLDAAFGNQGDGERDATSIWFNAAQAGDTAPFDGDVDLDDLNNVLNGFGATGPETFGGDVDGDGDVDFEDLNIVRNHFGASVATPAQANAIDSWLRELVRARLDEKLSTQAGLDWLLGEYATSRPHRPIKKMRR